MSSSGRHGCVSPNDDIGSVSNNHSNNSPWIGDGYGMVVFQLPNDMESRKWMMNLSKTVFFRRKNSWFFNSFFIFHFFVSFSLLHFSTFPFSLLVFLFETRKIFPLKIFYYFKKLKFYYKLINKNIVFLFMSRIIFYFQFKKIFSIFKKI